MAAWKDPQNFALWLSMVLFLLVTFIGIFVYFTRLYFQRLAREQQKLQATILAHQKQLLEDSIEVQERERRRIAADLHDDLISKLAVTLLTLQTTGDIEQGSLMLKDGIRLARHISHDLSPPLLEEHQLGALIEHFLHPIQQQLDVIYLPQLTSDKVLPVRKRLQLFRIFQEAVNNILKHAEASVITVQFRLSESLLVLRVSDNGKGFDQQQIPAGLGFKNIALRCDMIDGRFRFYAQPNKGTSFLFCLAKPFITI